MKRRVLDVEYGNGEANTWDVSRWVKCEEFVPYWFKYTGIEVEVLCKPRLSSR